MDEINKIDEITPPQPGPEEAGFGSSTMIEANKDARTWATVFEGGAVIDPYGNGGMEQLTVAVGCDRTGDPGSDRGTLSEPQKEG